MGGAYERIRKPACTFITAASYGGAYLLSQHSGYKGKQISYNLRSDL